MKIGLFFGTFNPIHNGHLIMANFILNNTEIDKIVFVLSPNAPFKEKNGYFASMDERSKMMELALQDIPNMSYTRIEEYLPEPTYTYNTLQYLSNNSDLKNEYILILGSDNFFAINSWYKYKEILTEFKLKIITRGCYELFCNVKIENLRQEVGKLKGIEVIRNIPTCSLSSTFIRLEASKGNNLYYYTPKEVAEYIHNNKLYTNF